MTGILVTVKEVEEAIRRCYPLPSEVALGGALPHGARIARELLLRWHPKLAAALLLSIFIPTLG